jgi:hypothetical protein
VLRPVSPRPSAPRSALARAGAVLLLASVGLVGLSTSASADPQVTVTDEAGASDGTVTAGTVVTVSGSGFQSVQGGAGGIYVVFGWVDDAEGGGWRPSAGGATGLDYLYAPDTEDAENAGFQRFVAFPGSSTSAAANGGVIAEDGTWSTPLTVPAPQFDALDRAGDAAPVDCTQVQCGIITFGAHGIKNATNETFTPVSFADPAAEAAAATAAATAAEEAPAAAPGGGSGRGAGGRRGRADRARHGRSRDEPGRRARRCCDHRGPHAGPGRHRGRRPALPVGAPRPVDRRWCRGAHRPRGARHPQDPRSPVR